MFNNANNANWMSSYQSINQAQNMFNQMDNQGNPNLNFPGVQGGFGSNNNNQNTISNGELTGAPIQVKHRVL